MKQFRYLFVLLVCLSVLFLVFIFTSSLTSAAESNASPLINVSNAGEADVARQPQVAAESHASDDSGDELIRQAWERAKESGSYGFDADITQIQRPLASVLNVGKTAKQDNFYLEGITNLAEQSLEMTLWSQGGTVQDENTGAQIRIEGDTAYARQGNQPWEEVNNFTGAFAPDNDFLGYLVAATNVQDLGQETRAGIQFTRLTFDIDGLAYARVIRDQMQAEMAQRGELLQGEELALPSIYRDMTGRGELWLDADGLPLRQLLQLDFAPEDDSQVSAEVSINFRDFAPVAIAALPDGSPAATALSQLTGATPAQTVAAVNQFTTNSLPMLVVIVLVVLFVTTLLYSQRSRTVLVALQLTFIVAMLTSPLLRGAHAQDAFTRRQDRVKASETRTQESDMTAALNASRDRGMAVSNAGTLDDILNDSGLDSDNDGYTDVAERFLGTNPKTKPSLSKMLPAPALETPLVQLPADDGRDTDEDGLTDYVEALLGTLPDNADSDGDLIPDGQEVRGFTDNGVDWVTDPLEMDTNRDGISDGIEWTIGAVNDIPANGDSHLNDTVPDLFDNDNDGDGVPDKLDLSPSTSVTNTFDGDNPFSLVLNGLADDKITYVEFQLVPTNTEHLRYTYNAFDWPDDRQGHIQDANFSKADVRLIPMLELIVPGASQDLLPTDTLKQYSIFPQSLPGDNQAVYVPLNLVRDPQGSRAVAFNGKMVYNSAANWGAAHQVRLVWLVQMQNDICTAFDDTGLCSSYVENGVLQFDQPQIIQTYEDSWHLTGLTVRENHGTDVATVYQDLDVVAGDKTDDTPLWQLSYGLDHSFMAGGVVTGTNDTVWDIPEIAKRFDHTTNGGIDIEQRWNITNTLSVITSTYDHLDEALMTTVQTTTLNILNNQFSPHAPVSPTLLFARQDEYRNFNLDEMAFEPDKATWGQTIEDGNKLTLNIPESAVPMEVSSTLSWTPYLYDDFEAAWKLYPIEQYWEYLDQKITPAMIAEYTDVEAAGGATFVAQIYYMSLVNGLHNIVQLGEQRLEKDYWFEDKPIGASIAKVSGVGFALIVEKAIDTVDNLADLKEIYRLYYAVYSNSGSDFIPLEMNRLEKLAAKLRTLNNNKGAALGVTLAIIVAVGIGAHFLYPEWEGNTEGTRITLAVLVGSVLFYATVISPLKEIKQVALAIQKAKTILKGSPAALGKVSESITKGAKIGAAIGLVFAISISWGIFLYAVNSGGLTPGSVAFNTLLAQTIAATILAVIEFVLSLTIAGAIIVALFAIVDILLLVLGVSFSLAGWFTEQLGKALYHFELTVSSDIDTGSPDLNLVDPNGGMVGGAVMAVNMPITTTLNHKSPQDGWGYRVLPYLPIYYTESNLKSTTFAYSLSTEEDPFNVKRDKMRGQWDTSFDRTYALSPFYQGENVANPTIPITLTTGLNQSLPLYLNSSYALPGVDCWTVPLPVWPWVAPVCVDKTIAGKDSSQIGASILLDVLPATLDEFVAFNWGGNVQFPTQPDWDNDGLITQDLNGNDPNDLKWDSDNDGLSDSYEIARRENGVPFQLLSHDSDFDGLSDYDEVRFGTNPGFQDTDQDGLKDSVEVWHFDTMSQTWTGGWDFTVTYIATDTVTTVTETFRIFSDPLQGDADRDGMSDGIEKALHLEDPDAYPFNPNVFDESPVALYLTTDDADGFVKPNQSVTISATVSNNLSDPLFALGNYSLTLPASLGSSQIVSDFNIFQGNTESIVTTAIVAGTNSPIVISASSIARLHDGDLSWSYGWTPLGSTPVVANTGNEFYFAQLANNPDPNADPYALIALEAPQEGLPAPYEVYDDIDVLAAGLDDQGPVRVAQAGASNVGTFSTKIIANADISHTYKVGNSEPAIACNDQGQCLQAYVEVEWNRIVNASDCANVSIEKIKATESAKYTLKLLDVSTSNTVKIWEGTVTAGQTLAIDSIIEACKDDRIILDSSKDWVRWETLELSAPHQATISSNFGGAEERATVTYTVLPSGVRRLGAIQLLLSDGLSEIKAPAYLEFPNSTDRVPQTANPAIATSGSDWLVGFESYGYPTEIHTQLFIDDPSGPSSEKAERLDYWDHYETGENDRNLALVWAGNQYLAVWERETTGVTGNDIKIAFLNSSGVITEDRDADNSMGNQEVPAIAYSAALNQSLLVYVSGNKIVGRFIQGKTIGDAFDIGVQRSRLFDPDVVYDEINNVWIVSWLDQNNNGSKSYVVALAPNPDNEAATPVTSQYEIDTPTRFVLDLACQPPTQRPINRNISQPTFCSTVSSANHLGNGTLQLDSFQLTGTPPWIGEGTLESSAARSMIVDNDDPIVTFTSFTGTLKMSSPPPVFGGDASDMTSNIALVRARIGNTLWQTATGTSSWSLAWNAPFTDGQVEIQVEATDAVGHTGTKSITIYLDGTAPTTTIDQTASQFVAATQDENDRYHLAFSGTANDGNGVTAVEALISPSGSGWQTATVSGNNWTLDYVLPEYDTNSNPVINPTGNYTITLRAQDSLGNLTDSDAYVTVPFRLDNTAPEAMLLNYGPSRGIISDTITLSGVITDPGAVASGIQQLEIDLVPVGQLSDTWQTATLANSGAGVANSSWSYAIPSGIEGNYLINLRGTDQQGNQGNQGSWFSDWQGEIDTWSPRVEVTVTLLYTGTAAKTSIQATITDRNLTELGLESPCNVTSADRVTEIDVLPDDIDPGRERLVALNLDCRLSGHVDNPITLRVFDIFGHETTQTIIASSGGGTLANAPQLAIQDGALVSVPLTTTGDGEQANELLGIVQMATQITAQASVSPTLLAGTVLTPAHDSVITDISAPITIDGGAYGINGLKVVTLTINSTFHYSTTLAASPVVTDTLWQTTWTPPGEGVYELVTTVEDWTGGQQTDLYPVTVIVDTSPPAVTLATTVLTDTHRLSFGRLELTGTVTDTQGIEAVNIAIDGGPAMAAEVDGTDWRYVWTPLIDPDGSTHSAVITAYDGGNETSITNGLVVDVVAPQIMTVTLGYTTGGTPVAINERDTVRDPATTGLTISWTDATDGSGVAGYRVGWTNSATPTLSALTAYANAATLHTTAVSEASLWFGHAAVFDSVGNRTINTSGPIVVDAPTTPDYINPADGLGGVYRGWMDSGCSLVGADYEVARYAPDGSSLDAVQKFYTTWDATHLRLAWTGADWRVDGDLFIYLDTKSGGATSAYNPYDGAGAAITMPDEGSGPLGADYLIFIEDGRNAMLRSWVNGDWDNGQPLTAPNFLFDPHSDVAKTDLYIPFNWLGSPTTLKMVAVASEEDSLNLWAAMPDHNPLNSQRAVNPAAITTLDLPFALTQQYEWANVGSAGVCPAAGHFQNADLRFELVSEPAGVSVGFLQHDLPGLTPPNSALDANLDGVIDAPLPLDVDPVPVGRDAVISYTLHYANDGPADATNVVADIAAAGGLKNLSANSLSLGTIAADSAGSVSFTAVIDPDVDGESAEIQVEVYDAVHAPFDWLWQQHDIDSQGPTDVEIVSPITYINPYTNTLRGIATDVSGIPEITLRNNGSSTQTCLDTTPNDGEWSCLWNANGAAQGTSFQFEARGTDEWGNTGNYGPAISLTVDRGFPDISLSQQTINSLADGFLSYLEAFNYKLSGSVSDSNEAGGAEICALADGETEPTCVEVPVNASGQTIANWIAEPPIPQTADGEIYTLSFTGIDSAGNRTPTPITYTVAADFAGPAIQFDNWPTIVSQYTRLNLTGTISDSSGVDSFEVRQCTPITGTQYVCKRIDLGSGPDWSHEVYFSYRNRYPYTFSFTARDSYGNYSRPYFRIEVVAPNSNLPPTADTGGPYVVGEGQTVVLYGSMSDPNGGALTPSWDLDDDGIFEITGVLTPTFDATTIDGPDQRTIKMRVSDGQLNTTDSTLVYINNQRPSADAGGPYTVAEGGQLTVSGSGVDIFAGDVLSYSWDLDGDGLFGDVVSATAVYDASDLDGTQFSSVSLQVTDDDGGATIATAPITITNIAPIVANIAIAPVNENGVATLSGNMADASSLDSFELVVDWGDGSSVTGYAYAAGTTAFAETHRYLDDNPSGTPTAVYTVSLTLTDDDDGLTMDNATATVNNVAPTLSNLSITDVNENGTATLTGNWADVGTQDSFTMTVDWGDGTAVSTFTYPAATTSFNESHQYLDDNPTGTPVNDYTVIVTLADDDTGGDSDNLTVTVSNLNPTLSNTAITNVDENGVATLTGNMADIGTQDSYTLTVDWGDLSATSTYTYPAGTTAFTETHQYLDDNPSDTALDDYTVDLTLTDDDTGSDTTSATVTVTNLNPTLSDAAITNIDENGVAVLTGDVADVGVEDSFTLDVDWGDLSATSTYTYPAGTTTFTESHQYLDDNPGNTAADDYTVSLTLTDDDTGTDVDSTTVTVTNVRPLLGNVIATDEDENGFTTLSGTINDPGSQDTFTMTVAWDDGSPLEVFTYSAGTNSFSEMHQYVDDDPSGTPSDVRTISLDLVDDDGGRDSSSTDLTISNVDPRFDAMFVTDVDENGVSTLSGTFSDPGTLDSFVMTVDWGDDSATDTYNYAVGTRSFTETHKYLDDNPDGTPSDVYTLTVTLTDDDTGSVTTSPTMTTTNLPPWDLQTDVISQTLQYSDHITPVTVLATDVVGDPLLASTTWHLLGDAPADGLPSGLALVPEGCLTSTSDDNIQTCSWALSGAIQMPAGEYQIKALIADDDLGLSSINIDVTVEPEDSVISFDGDNPVAVQVTEPESNASLPFEMVVYVEELEPDQAFYQAAPGDISLAEVSIMLEPVGPGGAVTVACTTFLIDDTTDDYGDILQATCNFADVPVNTYSVNVLVDGGYYDGYDEDVLVVYDPSLGFTTGGGWFYWPGSEELASGYPGDKTNFGYSMSYNKNNLKNVRGSLLLIRHLADGTKYRVKSNALEGLSIGDAGTFGWASFSGKANYLAPEPEFWDATLGVYIPKGNYTFLAYVADHDEPGNGIDEFWIEIREPDNKGGGVVEALSLTRPGSAYAEQIQGGNIVAPHSGVDVGNLPPSAGFNYATAGLDVTFADASSDTDGTVVSWAWDFGDGNSSAAQNPNHGYAAGGNFNVTLTVTDNEGASDSASQQVTVSGDNQPPQAEFSFSATGLAVNFSDLSDDPDGTVDSWSWDFSDGANSSAQNPSHTFPSSGTYDVLLTATDNDGATDTFGQQVTVSDGSGVTEMYVADLAGTSTPDGGGSWNAVVTILVQDEFGDPITNATVSGTWSKGFFASTSCTTNVNGLCQLEQTGIDSRTRHVTFYVDDVTHTTLTYNAALNVMSSTRVDRP